MREINRPFGGTRKMCLDCRLARPRRIVKRLRVAGRKVSTISSIAVLKTAFRPAIRSHRYPRRSHGRHPPEPRRRISLALSPERLKELLCRQDVARAEPLGEASVDFGKQVSCLSGFVSRVPEPREACGRP